jgi:hypothetical protein
MNVNLSGVRIPTLRGSGRRPRNGDTPALDDEGPSVPALGLLMLPGASGVSMVAPVWMLSAGGFVLQNDPHALDPANPGGVDDVGASIGLAIEADDLDHAQRVDATGD